MEDLWSVICEDCGFSENGGKPFCFDLNLLKDPSSCINHVMVVCFDVFLLIMLSFIMILKPSSRPLRRVRYSNLQIVSAITNGFLGFLHLSLGIWVLEEKLRKTHTVFPLDAWLLDLFHGFVWLSVSLTVSLQVKQLSRAWLWMFSVLIFFVSGILCALSMSYAIGSRKLSIEAAIDVLSFPGATLLMFCTYKACTYEDTDGEIGERLYAPLNSQFNEFDTVGNVTPFSKAGFFSKSLFWWLNPFMKSGQEKTLLDEDIPKLRETDRAESCYLSFVEQLNKQSQHEPLSSHSSVLWTIIMCHRREILITGLFALLKVLTLSSGPLLLNEFILVAEGKKSFKYEGCVLAISLFFIKIVESLSQRQWYFRSRLVGMKVRSLLTAAIYKKILRLSNSARLVHSSGEIMNYMTVDVYRIGEFPFWFHKTWTTILQLSIALVILFQAIGLATIASLAVIVLTVVCNTPLAKLQHKFQSKLMVAQDERLKASSEALVNMKVLKLYAWETHFKNVVDSLRNVELKLLSDVQIRRSYHMFFFWTSPILVSGASFLACYFLNVPLNASNVFTFVATLRLVQDPISNISDVIAVIIQAKVAFARIVNFLEAPELQSENCRKRCFSDNLKDPISIKCADFSWEDNKSKPTLTNINLDVRHGQNVAICGEVGSGKSTLLATILGEVSKTKGTIDVHGTFAYVSQTTWIQTGTVRENILFGSELDNQRYQETLQRSSLERDLELFPYGDLTEIGERGVNLSGGQKQRIQLARALYQNADIYLLDDPFSAVDAHTAKSLFNDYIMEGLKGKTVLLVTHQVDFLPAFDSVLLMSYGEILHAGPYHQLLTSSQEFNELVNAHKETASSDQFVSATFSQKHSTSINSMQASVLKQYKEPNGSQLIHQEEKEKGNTGLKPYFQYLNRIKGYTLFFVASLCHLIFVVCQILQNSWMAANVDNPLVSTLQLILVYFLIGALSSVFLFMRCLLVVILGLQSSKDLFSQLMNSLFRAPMPFYDSTPLGRVLSRVSSDLSIVDLDIPFSLTFAVAGTIALYSNLTVLAIVTWPVLIVAIPMVYVALHMQKYYFASAKEVMRLNGTTKSSLANHVAETVAGAVTIRAFKEEDRSFEKNLDLIDNNASAFFHSFASTEWLIQRLETISAVVLAAATICLVMLPPGTFPSGIIGMALSYGLSLNGALVFAIQNQCTLANHIISVERLNQYMHIQSEAGEIVEGNRPPLSWPIAGKVEINDLKIRYRHGGPLVLHGITCTFKAGHKIGIVGRTGSGKSTLIGALFRLVEPAEGKVVVDGIDISSIGLHDLRSRLGIIPQDPTLFNGTVRFNLDPLSQHTDQEIWEVLGKCQLREVVQGKEEGLNSSVVEDGSNWSMGQRQLFCLGRALLRRSRILVLDEATASIDNSTDLIVQKTIRAEFADCTVITVAHRIPTVMDCTMVLAISDGKLAEYDEPMRLMKREESIFRQLVKEYWSHFQSAESH